MKTFEKVEKGLKTIMERQEDLFINHVDWYGSVEQVEDNNRMERKIYLSRFVNELSEVEYDRLYDMYI